MPNPEPPELKPTIEAGLICPKCHAVNIPGAKPYIKLTEIVLVCDICSHAGPLAVFQPKEV